MESSIVEQEEADEAEADPLGPNRLSNEEEDEAALVFLMSILWVYVVTKLKEYNSQCEFLERETRE